MSWALTLSFAPHTLDLRWWRRAYEILNGMAQKGMFLSEQDKKDLEALRGKATATRNDETRRTKPE